MIDATHDPALRSWVASANADDTDFPIQNLPYGRFRRKGSGQAWRIGDARVGPSVSRHWRSSSSARSGVARRSSPSSLVGSKARVISRAASRSTAASMVPTTANCSWNMSRARAWRSTTAS